jgi:hypothetical protein
MKPITALRTVYEWETSFEEVTGEMIWGARGHLPRSVTILGETAFTGCGSLWRVIVDETPELFEIGGFHNCGTLANFGPQSSVSGVWNLRECPALKQVRGSMNTRSPPSHSRHPSKQSPDSMIAAV